MDYNIEDMLNSARELQKTYYKVDGVLMHRLASGCMANLAQAMHLDWKIVNHDAKQEREKLMGMVDAFHYILSLLSCHEEDSLKLYRTLICRRHMIEELHKSYDSLNELLKKDLKAQKIAVVDVDNILYPYDDVWGRFKAAHGVPDDMTRDDCKNLYRTSGLKAITPPLEGAKEFLDVLWQNGFTIVLLSARDVDLYPEVYVDTLEFLKKYGLKYDYALFKKEKRDGEILPKLLPFADLFIDDRRDQIDFALQSGVEHAIWVTSPDTEFPTEENVTRIPDIKLLEELFKKHYGQTS